LTSLQQNLIYKDMLTYFIHSLSRNTVTLNPENLTPIVVGFKNNKSLRHLFEIWLHTQTQTRLINQNQCSPTATRYAA